MDCLSLAQTIFADLAAGNLEAVLQRCADDVRFTAVRTEPCAAVPAYGEYVGKDGARQFFQKLGAAVEFGEFRLDGAAGEVLPDYLAGCLRQPAGGAPAGGETGSGERGGVERFEAA